MRGFALVLLFSLSVSAQKKPVTLETLQGGGRGGRGGFAGFAGAPTWLPDGKTFLTRQGRNLSIYDPATKLSNTFMDVSALDDAAVRMPAEESGSPTDWSNRRARVAGMQFSADGRLILYGAGG